MGYKSLDYCNLIGYSMRVSSETHAEDNTKMTPNQIKIYLLQKQDGDPRRDYWTITAIAARIHCRRQELSMCIRQVREYPRIRAAFARELGVSVEYLFGKKSESAQAATV